MTANTLPTKAPITAGAQVAALVPQTLEEAFRISQAIAASGMAPRGLEKPEQIMVAIMAGAELGFAPFQSLQSFAVVNGRPTLWGDGLVAVVRRNGCTINEWHEGETAFCEVTRPDTGEKIVRQFSQEDAKKAGLAGKTGPWQQYPARMRAMRARAWAVRDGCADMLRGFQVAEEVQDYEAVRDVTPKTTGLLSRLEQREAAPTGFSADHVARETGLAADLDEALDGDTIPAHDADTGEIFDAEVEDAGEVDPDAPGEAQEAAQEAAPATQGPTLSQRATAYEGRLRDAATTTKLRSLHAAAEKLRTELDAADPERLAELDALFNDRYAELSEVEHVERAAQASGGR